MDPQQRKILKEKCNLIKDNISFKQIKPLLMEFKLFNKYMWEDINTMSDVFDFLPWRGPTAFEQFVRILRKSNYVKEADYLELFSNSKKLTDSLNYKMSSHPLGYCLIINNVEFDKKDPVDDENPCLQSSHRWGSDKDAWSLRNFFEGIGYVVLPEPNVKNMKTQQMWETLEKFSKSEFKNVDSCIVIILSHGGRINNEDVLYGTDWGHIVKDTIIDLFNNKNCEGLQGKPKLFLFVACRGNLPDYGAVKVVPKESFDSVGIACKEVVPTPTDIMIVHSTMPHQLSVRDHEEGSWFCQDFISVVKDFHDTYDFDTIIKLVNLKLEKRISIDYRVKQAIHTEGMGVNKRLILCRNTDN